MVCVQRAQAQGRGQGWVGWGGGGWGTTAAHTSDQDCCSLLHLTLIPLLFALVLTLSHPAAPNNNKQQLYGADERTAGVVPVGFGGRAQPAAGWPPGQVTPSQMILVSSSRAQTDPKAAAGAHTAGRSMPTRLAQQIQLSIFLASAACAFVFNSPGSGEQQSASCWVLSLGK